MVSSTDVRSRTRAGSEPYRASRSGPDRGAKDPDRVAEFLQGRAGRPRAPITTAKGRSALRTGRRCELPGDDRSERLKWSSMTTRARPVDRARTPADDADPREPV